MTKAERLAKSAITEKVGASLKLRNFTYSDPALVAEYAKCFTFAASSEEMEEAGYTPAAVFVYIDKADGHVWSPQEIEDYFYSAAVPTQKAA